MRLRFPWMRDELLGYLNQLANPRLVPPGESNPVPLDYAVHFLFDDTVLADDPRMAIGDFIATNEEAEAVGRVVSILDHVLSVHGTHHPDEYYLQQPEWGAVLSAARGAIDCLLRADRAT